MESYEITTPRPYHVISTRVLLRKDHDFLAQHPLIPRHVKPPTSVALAGEFPEDRFVVQSSDQIRYRSDVLAGYQAMRRRRVVIAGLARDVAETLSTTIARIERVGRLFADYRVVIYENDSTDDTRGLLKAWNARNPQVTILSETRRDPINLPRRCLQRAERMAYYRNQCHAHIADHCRDSDNVIIVDTDLKEGWSFDGIAHTFGQSDWDFVGSHGLIYRRIGWKQNCAHHYDAWAFRRDKDYQPLPTKVVNSMNWNRGDRLVKVNSCFGGLGVYRTEAFLAGKYDGSDCEHVPLHRTMKENGFGRLFLNPNQITLYGRRQRTFDPLIRSCQKLLATCCFRPAPQWR